MKIVAGVRKFYIQNHQDSKNKIGFVTKFFLKRKSRI